MVRLRHASGFESYYLHLSAFGNGIRAGAHVDQGALIGRVGSTGTATGPHLDYRLKKNGVFVNPLDRASQAAARRADPRLRSSRRSASADQTLGTLDDARGRRAASGPTRHAGR